jgi:hypothetical protein
VTLIRAVIVPADTEIAPFQGQIDNTDLATYHYLVGGLIEAVTHINPPGTCYIDEEGKLKGRPVNQRATSFINTALPGFEGMDFLVGTALFVGPVDDDGYDTNVSQLVINHFRPE